MEAQELWTVQRMLNWCVEYLQKRGEERPRLAAEWLLCAATGLSRIELYVNFDRPLSAEELSRMHDGVLRRGKGEPLQYVTGEMPFRHIVLKCEEGVLIPRPETEVLVEAALEGVDRALSGGAEEARVLEIGTGTGCIACSVASERVQSYVVATDLSSKAVDLARRNADALGLSRRVQVLQSDLAEGVDERLQGSFSVLVSNPPYIPTDVMAELPREVVGFEPRLALDGGKDGLDVFRRILDAAPKLLAPGGLLCCELFEDNVETAARLCREQGGWASVEVRQDLTHRPRILLAVRQGDLAQAVSGLERIAAPDKVIKVDQATPARDVLLRAKKTLEADGVLVVPTDSVYGLCCAATPDNPAHRRIFEIKQRDMQQTLPLFLADISTLEVYARDVPGWALEVARAFWPGALTLVVHASDAVPAEYVRGDTKTIAVRVPDCNLVRMLAGLAGPLAQTSANTHGQAAATSINDLEERLIKEADLVLDGGPAREGSASTIVDATGPTPHILREGPLSADAIWRAAEL